MKSFVFLFFTKYYYSHQVKDDYLVWFDDKDDRGVKSQILAGNLKWKRSIVEARFSGGGEQYNIKMNVKETVRE